MKIGINQRESRGGRLFLTLASTVYFIYFFFFWAAGGFEANIFKVNWYLFSKLCLVFIPIYIFIIYYSEIKLFASDLLYVVAPISFWFLLVGIKYNKSLVNGLLVEPEMIILLSGFCFIIRIFASINFNVSRKITSISLFAVLLIGAWAIACFVPVIPE